jgi:hypothetical protein
VLYSQGEGESFAVPLTIRAIKKAASVSEGRSRGLNSIYLPGVVGASTTLRLISDCHS